MARPKKVAQTRKQPAGKFRGVAYNRLTTPEEELYACFGCGKMIREKDGCVKNLPGSHAGNVKVAFFCRDCR